MLPAMLTDLSMSRSQSPASTRFLAHRIKHRDVARPEFALENVKGEVCLQYLRLFVLFTNLLKVCEPLLVASESPATVQLSPV